MIRIWKGKQCVHYIVALSSVYTKHVSVNVDELQIMRRCLAYRARSQGCVLFDSWRFFKILGDRYLWIPKVGSFGALRAAKFAMQTSGCLFLRVQRSFSEIQTSKQFKEETNLERPLLIHNYGL